VGGVLLSLGSVPSFSPSLALVYCVVALAGDRTEDGRRKRGGGWLRTLLRPAWL